MKHALAAAWIAVSLSAIASDGAKAEPVLMLNEPRDIGAAKYSCDWAENEIKAVQYLIKADICDQSESCQRAIGINAACKVTGPLAEVRGFHTKLLSLFASNAQCPIAIMRLSDEKSDIAYKNNAEAFKRADWELNLSFTPGATKQGWALWPHKDGYIIASGVLEGEGYPGEIARDICTIMMRSGAKILN
jgi:hypothetical protein